MKHSLCARATTTARCIHLVPCMSLATNLPPTALPPHLRLPYPVSSCLGSFPTYIPASACSQRLATPPPPNSPLSFVNAICFAMSAWLTVGRFTWIERSKSTRVRSGSRSSSELTSVHDFSTAPAAPGEQGVRRVAGPSGVVMVICTRGVGDER